MWLLLVAGMGAVAVAMAALVLVLNDRGSDDTAGTADPTTAATASTGGVESGSITTPTRTGPTAAPVVTVVPAAPTTDGVAGGALPTAAPTRGRVARSCGARGTGDCFLSRRASPSSDATELGRLAEGDPIEVQCTVVGESVTASALGRPSRIWARTDDGAYVSMAFVDAPGFDLFSDSHPC